MIRSLVFALLVVVCGTQAPAPAAARETFHVAGWYGASVDRNGRFVMCAVSKSVGRGTDAIFIMSRTGGMSVALANKNFPFMQGAGVYLTYSIDGSEPVRVEARAINQDIIRFAIPSHTELVRRLRQGNRFLIRLRHDTIVVSLAGSAAALERMRQCVINRLDVEAGRAPRYLVRRPARTPRRAVARTASRGGAGSTRKAAGSNGGVSGAARRLEAVTYVANLLAKAGFRDYRILQQKEMRKQAGNRFDVVWRTSRSVGALRIYTGGQAKDFDELAARAIVLGTKACKGAFRSGVKREPDSPVLRFFTQCDGDDGWHALYAIVRGKGGKAYLVLSLGNGLSNRESGTGLREVDERIVQAMTARPLD